MNWIVSIRIYGRGVATYVEIANASKQELDITKKAEKYLMEDSDPDPESYDKSKEGKNFETQIFKKLKHYINLSQWKNLLEASFWAEKNKIIFDTGY